MENIKLPMEFEVKSPILGFENVTHMRFSKIDDIFFKLENTEDSYPSFVLVDPFALREYEIEAPRAIKAIMELDTSKNFLFLSIMIVHNPIEESTINFIAPLLLNLDTQTMAQVVLDSSMYPTYGMAEPMKNFLNKKEPEDKQEAEEKN